MPIEEVVLDPKDDKMLASKLLQREEYWIREWTNDDIRGVVNISRLFTKYGSTYYNYMDGHGA